MATFDSKVRLLPPWIVFSISFSSQQGQKNEKTHR